MTMTKKRGWPRGRPRNARPADHAKLLRRLRAATGFRSAIAQKLGVNPTTVNRWMNGELIPSPRSVDALRAMLDEIEAVPAWARRK